MRVCKCVCELRDSANATFCCSVAPVTVYYLHIPYFVVSARSDILMYLYMDFVPAVHMKRFVLLIVMCEHMWIGLCQ